MCQNNGAWIKFKNFALQNKAEVILVPLIFLLDFVTKILAVAFLLGGPGVKVFPFLRLTFVANTGAAFGSFQNGNFWLIIATAVILGLLLKWRKDLLAYGALARYGVIFIIGGALGNLFDRIVLGFVIDFLDFIVWPVFNVADSFISAGVMLLFLAMMKDYFFKNKEGEDIK